MPKLSCLVPKLTHSIKAKRTLCSLIFATGIVGQVASAKDYGDGTEVPLDLTTVPALGKYANSPTPAKQDTDQNHKPLKTQSPYLMLSSPTSRPAGASQKRPATTPAWNPSKAADENQMLSGFETINTQPAQRKSFISRMTSAPAKAIGVTCGVCVGVPISIARDTKKYTGQMKKSMDDGFGVEKTGDLAGHMWSGACAIPFGIGSGIVHGSMSGVQRAVEHGQNQPFSKESMSLGSQERSLSNRPDDSGNN